MKTLRRIWIGLATVWVCAVVVVVAQAKPVNIPDGGRVSALEQKTAGIAADGTMSAAKLTAGTAISAVNLNSATNLPASALQAGTAVPAINLNSATNIPAANLTGVVHPDRIATALASPGAIGGTASNAASFTTVKASGKYVVTGPAGNAVMQIQVGGPSSNIVPVAYGNVFGAGTVRVFLCPAEASTTTGYVATASINTTNFTISAENDKTFNWMAVGVAP